MRSSPILLALLCLTMAIPASADELETLRTRVEQLEATVEELTLQLADAVRERRRLEAELAEAMAAAEVAAAAPVAAASSAPPDVATGGPSPAADEVADAEIEETPVAGRSAPASSAQTLAAAAYGSTSDCDVSQALAGYDGKRGGNEALAAWLEADDHLAKCSTEQLREIRDAVKWDWLGYEKPVLKLLDKELARRD